MECKSDVATLRPRIGSCCDKATYVPSGTVTKEILRYTFMKGNMDRDSNSKDQNGMSSFKPLCYVYTIDVSNHQLV